MRHIVLREFRPGLACNVAPPHAYVAEKNGTLVAQDVFLRIDEQGFMVTEAPRTREDAPILLLGGSAVENLYIPEPDRIFHRVETALRKGGVPAKVYGAGISDAHLLHMINLLLNKGLGLRPKVVVYYPTPGADVLANESENGFWNEHPQLTTLGGGKGPAPAPKLQFTNRNRFDDERRLLGVLSDICANFGAKLLMCTWPLGVYDEYIQARRPERASFDVENDQYARVNDVIREVSRERGVSLIDLAAEFTDVNHGAHFYDWNHPNVQGCERIASITTAAIRPFL